MSMSDYLGMLERAFSPDMEVALLGSVELALEFEVASEEVLNSDANVLAYFFDQRGRDLALDRVIEMLERISIGPQLGTSPICSPMALR